uniref:BTB domain-containing protein n=1 Tax=Panagrolaimus davidi TaxID=227884 RepID=A0A914R1Z2_9BILA
MSNTNPASLISYIFRSDFVDSPTTSKSSHTRKRRRSMHEEYRCLLEQGKLSLVQMDNETFIYWVMDDSQKIAIYCKICEKFLGPKKGGSFFTHVRTCKNQIFSNTLPSASISQQQKEDFSFTVVDAIQKDLNLFTHLNNEAFKQCIQKALIIGFEVKLPGYGPPDASELFKNASMESIVNNTSNVVASEVEEPSSEWNNILPKNELLSPFIKNEESITTSPSFETKNIIFDALRSASTLGEEIFNANEYTDVILNTSDGKEIAAHRCFLSRASAVFKNTFDQNPNSLLKIDIEFDEIITLKAVHFCYGNYFVIDGYEKQLLKFAKIYQFHELKERCLSNLFDTVTLLNVCKIVEIAYEHNCEYLKQKCVQTILENKEALGKETINKLTPPVLCDILFAQ